ncbi:hypothetical protein GCM10009630_53760 [Kribbella jejuensis]|uniref:Polyisoprenoid-binding protein YceI n=1 Tax=Kribbella jejuensis TaxID=236068 RepID=A0A542EWH5_9ACTN|nr:YceI family protein [Kribbella jejuensis]TQJ19708.1 polyisoprenoid-binding protein YceI [Kribbella jejuensis]
MISVDEYVLDPTRTRIAFTATHRWGTRVHGHFTTFEGGTRAGNPWLTVQLDSLDTANPRRDTQLRRDFFDTKSHPTMTFETTSITQVSTSRYDVTGNLTIRGDTHPLTIPFTVTETPETLQATATTTLNRHTWHTNWNTFTTALVRPTVVIDLAVTATHR